MKIVHVTYTTTPDYATQNQENIKAIMDDLQKLNAAGINYTACVKSDGKTFIHSAFFESEDGQKTLNELPSFKNFQEQLKASGLESPPKQELLNLVGSSQEIFTS